MFTWLEIYEIQMGNYLLFPPSATAVVAAIISVAVTRSIAHPANFLTGARKEFVWSDDLAAIVSVKSVASTYIAGTSTVFARFSPHSHANVAALCMKCSSSAKISKKQLQEPFLLQTRYIIYLNGWRVGNLDNLLAIHKETGCFCRNIPRPRRCLGKGIHWLAWSK